MKHIISLLKVGVAVAMIAIAGVNPANAACDQQLKVKFKIASNTLEMGGMSNVFSTPLSFVTTGTTGCAAIVRFSAEDEIDFNTFDVLVHAVLDDGSLALPGDVVWFLSLAGNTYDNTVHSFEFIFPRVPPGNHTVQVQSWISGGYGRWFKRTLTVTYQ